MAGAESKKQAKEDVNRIHINWNALKAGCWWILNRKNHSPKRSNLPKKAPVPHLNIFNYLTTSKLKILKKNNLLRYRNPRQWRKLNQQSLNKKTCNISKRRSNSATNIWTNSVLIIVLLVLLLYAQNVQFMAPM